MIGYYQPLNVRFYPHRGKCTTSLCVGVFDWIISTSRLDYLKCYYPFTPFHHTLPDMAIHRPRRLRLRQVRQSRPTRNIAQQSRKRRAAADLLKKAKIHLSWLSRLKTTSNIRCLICFKQLKADTHQACAVRCGHVFGYTCIQTLMETNDTQPVTSRSCPVCKCEFDTHDILRLYFSANCEDEEVSDPDPDTVVNAYKRRIRVLESENEKLTERLDALDEWNNDVGEEYDDDEDDEDRRVQALESEDERHDERQQAILNGERWKGDSDDDERRDRALTRERERHNDRVNAIFTGDDDDRENDDVDDGDDDDYEEDEDDLPSHLGSTSSYDSSFIDDGDDSSWSEESWD